MKLEHARPGDTLERHDDAGWHVIEIVTAFAGTGEGGEPARFVDCRYVDREPDDADVIRLRADTDPHDWRRVDHEADARAGFAALVGAGSIPPALTEGQMIRAAADALGVKMVSRVPGDDEPLPAGVSVRIVGAAANGGSRNARSRGRR